MGGTFDPVHNGHLQLAHAAADDLNRRDVGLMPCYVAPHKTMVTAPAHHRLAMLEHAVAEYNQQSGTHLYVETWEMQQDSPSWTAHTVAHFHQLDGRPIVLVMGMDSFIHLSSWRDAEQLMASVNIWVGQRDNHQPLPHTQEANWLKSGQTQQASDLFHGTGRIYVANNPQWSISSTVVRDGLIRGTMAHLPESVQAYIRTHGLYRQ